MFGRVAVRLGCPAKTRLCVVFENTSKNDRLHNPPVDKVPPFHRGFSIKPLFSQNTFLGCPLRDFSWICIFRVIIFKVMPVKVKQIGSAIYFSTAKIFAKK